MRSDTEKTDQKDTGKMTESRTVAAAADEWLLFMSCRVKESSLMTYRNMIRCWISPSLGNDEISGIDQKRIDDFIGHLATSAKKDGTGLSPKTVSDVVSVLKSILLYSQKTKNIPFCAEFRLPRCPRSEIHVFSPTEQEKLLVFITREDKTKNNKTENKRRIIGDCRNLGILLSLYTGLRIGEVCALQWKDISFDEKTIIVRKTLQRISDPSEKDQKTKLVMTDPKSDCSKRIIPLPDFLTAFLADFQRDGDDFILSGNKKPIEPRNLQNHFRKILQECGIRQTNYHTLRHTFATRCVEIGFDIKCLSEILGHSNISMTLNRYVHPSMSVKRKNMNLLGKFAEIRPKS